MSSPKLHIIAGPNGSGKTTFAKEFLPSVAKCDLFVNADLIAQGLSPLSPVSANMKAGRLQLTQIREFALQRRTFAFETTLAGKTYSHLLRKLKEQGYEIHIYFLWVSSVELALKRIEERVKSGGHNVPEKDVRRRYKAGLINLFSLYQPLADSVTIVENSGSTPKLIASGNSEQFQEIDPDTFKKLRQEAFSKEKK
ncbi:MAG: zeta toxin family protein [Elusimicrobia bacterium]|nr:zeta toxin family protein [Candidatus Obscuribacterium magneticum]MCB4755472.1 zeta toxin family protein [Candidatus Obscuribacterium magneticum]